MVICTRDSTKVLKASLSMQSAGMDYFTCVLLRQTTIYLDKAVNTGFENSKMGRGLQRIDCHVGKVKISFMNVHLESTKDFAKERVEQLEKCLSEIKLLKDDTTAILAGDMNIRDKEVASLSNGTGLPPNIKDVWESLGKRKEAQYSWDTMRNTNLQVCTYVIVHRFVNVHSKGFFGVSNISQKPNENTSHSSNSFVQGLKNWIGSTWNTIKLIGSNSQKGIETKTA